MFDFFAGVGEIPVIGFSTIKNLIFADELVMQIDDSSGESMSSINSATCQTPSCSGQRRNRAQKYDY